MRSGQRGFTLVEVLTVIAIIGILTTLTTYTYNSSLKRSRDSQRLTDLKSIQNSLEQYYLDKRTYPNYKYNLIDHTDSIPHVAKFQLEQFPKNLKEGRCQDPFDTDGTYLAPNYMTSVPEDPQNKSRLSGGQSVCQLEGPRPPGAYQYHYVPLMTARLDSRTQPLNGYYLMAKMERRNNVSPNLSTIRTALQDYNTSRALINLPTAGESGSRGGDPYTRYVYFYCSRAMTGDPTAPGCHINYLLSNKDR